MAHWQWQLAEKNLFIRFFVCLFQTCRLVSIKAGVGQLEEKWNQLGRNG